MTATSGFRARHLVIVGLGLMGGSAALALRDYADRITGIDSSAPTREYALRERIVDHATDDLKAGVADADVVVLAAPVRVIIQIVQGRIGAYLRSNTFLIDLGSTKEDICSAMGQLPIGIQAVGGHPMTGKEVHGIEASDPALYHQRPFVLCPTRRTTPATRLRSLAFVDALGAQPIEMDAHRHDRTVAAISHLPYLLSAALVATVKQEGDRDEAVWELAAGGFRDTSRLAASNLDMMGDILSTNTQAVAALLAHFRAQLALLEAALIDRDAEQLAERLRPVRAARLTWAHKYERKP
ncbi:MAG: prephenate dehydrogenase [Anaerolineae bacterium]|nr:prephenate dehydrogenase [Anaerolineae bacterium]